MLLFKRFFLEGEFIASIVKLFYGHGNPKFLHFAKILIVG